MGKGTGRGNINVGFDRVLEGIKRVHGGEAEEGERGPT